MDSHRVYYRKFFDLDATVCGVKTESRSVYAKRERGNNIFIQTDKPIYKPGQKSMNIGYTRELFHNSFLPHQIAYLYSLSFEFAQFNFAHLVKTYWRSFKFAQVIFSILSFHIV